MVTSIIISLLGYYYKHEEIKNVLQPKMKASPPPATCKDSSPTNKIRHNMDSKYVYA